MIVRVIFTLPSEILPYQNRNLRDCVAISRWTSQGRIRFCALILDFDAKKDF